MTPLTVIVMAATPDPISIVLSLVIVPDILISARSSGNARRQMARTLYIASTSSFPFLDVFGARSTLSYRAWRLGSASEEKREKVKRKCELFVDFLMTDCKVDSVEDIKVTRGNVRVENVASSAGGDVKGRISSINPASA